MTIFLIYALFFAIHTDDNIHHINKEILLIMYLWWSLDHVNNVLSID